MQKFCHSAMNNGEIYQKINDDIIRTKQNKSKQKKKKIEMSLLYNILFYKLKKAVKRFIL